jgi:DNA-directed RNA polymerase specialized sigma24 family protein
MGFAHSWIMRGEGEVVRFPTERVEARARFDEVVEDEHERLYKALYFVTGNREDAEDLAQDAFLKLWERWDQRASGSRRCPPTEPRSRI